MKMSRMLLIFSLLLCSHQVVTFKILAIVSMPFRSHYMAFERLFRELAVRGHYVTVMNNFPDAKPTGNLTFVDLQRDLSGMLTLTEYESMDSLYIRYYNVYRHGLLGPPGVKSDCENLFINENAIAHYNSGVRYDVIFVEQFMSDCGLAYAAILYDAPIIGIKSHVMLPWTYSRLGLPFDVVSDAFYFSDAGANPPVLRKIENIIFNLALTGIRWKLDSNIYEVFNRFVPSHTFDIDRVAKDRMKMIFSYQHFSLTGARPVAPQLIEIAGIHISTPGNVTKDIENFLATANHGAILVSFGSNLKASTMSQKKLQHFINAFKKMPYKVLWKWENSTFPSGYEDLIYTKEWFSQLDVLCHPKIMAFVSHGGMLSISEAAHCGTPVLTIPFFGDQFDNAASVRGVGLGKTLYFNELNADNLEAVIRELMAPEMQDSAKRVSSQWHDRPQPVMDSAIYWTEYVARHRSAPPSLPGKDSTWFENLLLDVYLAVFLIFLVVLFLIYVVFKMLKWIVFKLLRTLFISKSKHE